MKLKDSFYVFKMGGNVKGSCMIVTFLYHYNNQTGYILENSHHDVWSYDPKGQTGLGKPTTHKMLCQ